MIAEKTEILGLAEVAKLLGWERSKINTYLRRGDFPAPYVRLAATPVWTREQIEDYVAKKKEQFNKKFSLKW